MTGRAHGRDGAPLCLVFVIAGLDGGGAERVLTILANESAARGHHVIVLTLGGAGADFFPLHASIHRARLGFEQRSANPARRVSAEGQLLRALRRTLRRLAPDAVVSFATETNVRVLVASLGLGLRLVVSERSDPASMPLTLLWRTLRRSLYRLAAVVVVQTDDARRWIESHTSARRIVAIPNPVTMPAWQPVDALPLQHPVIVTLARLRPEKGVDMLLDAFARTRRDHPGWHLAIIGDGVEREALERQARTLGIAEAVRFVGLLDRPAATLRQAELFVLSSRFEGFPNALVEAMALGLPVVSFDCPSGPRAIVRDGVDGVLVPAADVDALADAMRRLMADPVARARLGARATEVTDRFAVDRIVSDWLDAAKPARPTAAGRAFALTSP